jgi:L-threonylcarbamoyladenylate synthase
MRNALASGGVTTTDANAADAVDRAVEALAGGRAVVLPTDTVYGVAVALRVPGATELLFALKDRPADVPIAVLVASVAQAGEIADLPPAASPAGHILQRWWPGALTAVLPARAGEARTVGGGGTAIGVRYPDALLVRAIAERVGPLATTSANRHGQPTPSSAGEAAAALSGPVALVVDGGLLAGLASTVVDLTGPSPTVLREGAVSAAEVASVVAG